MKKILFVNVKLSLSIGSVCENIGFYKILFEVSNYEKLREYCYDVLGDIIKNDKLLRRNINDFNEKYDMV